MSFKIQTLNKIAAVGLNQLDRDNYEVATDINNPDAILVRSADMHEMNISDNTKAVARAGAGTNNIPIPELTEKEVYAPLYDEEEECCHRHIDGYRA